jgi:hypothetical protein
MKITYLLGSFYGSGPLRHSEASGAHDGDLTLSSSPSAVGRGVWH